MTRVVGLGPLAAREPGVDLASGLGSAPSQREGNSSPVGRSFPQDKSLVESSVLFFSQFASIRSWQIKLYLRLFKAKLYASGV